MTALLESIMLVFVLGVFFVFFSSFFSSKKFSPSFALVPPPARSLVAAAPLLVTPAEENAREEDEEEQKAKDRRLPAKKEFKRGESGSLVPVVPVVVVKGENTRIREDILLVIGKKKLAATPRNDDWSLVVVVAFFSLLTPLPLPNEKREERSAEDNAKNRRVEAREERIIFLTIYILKKVCKRYAEGMQSKNLTLPYS